MDNILNAFDEIAMAANNVQASQQFMETKEFIECKLSEIGIYLKERGRLRRGKEIPDLEEQVEKACKVTEKVIKRIIKRKAKHGKNKSRFAQKE